MFPELGMWRGETVAVLASGPSMTQADADACRGLRVITVNSTFQMAPWADVHYSSDADWWDTNLPRMRRECSGEFWTGHPFNVIADDVKVCPYDKKARGVIEQPGRIAWGGNSGYCAIGLAFQFGAARILLLGFDQQGEHWHAEHPEAIRKPANWPMWRERFGEMARDFARLGVEVVNCSRETSLNCFKRAHLKEYLKW